MHDEATWGTEPFRIGLWVGTDVSPETIRRGAEAARAGGRLGRRLPADRAADPALPVVRVRDRRPATSRPMSRNGGCTSTAATNSPSARSPRAARSMTACRFSPWTRRSTGSLPPSSSRRWTSSPGSPGKVRRRPCSVTSPGSATGTGTYTRTTSPATSRTGASTRAKDGLPRRRGAPGGQAPAAGPGHPGRAAPHHRARSAPPPGCSRSRSTR